MDITQLLEIFSNPETVATLSNGDLLKAIIFTIIMGMGTTALVLTVLMLCTSLMHKLSGQIKIPAAESDASGITEKSAQTDEELAIIITAAAAAVLNTNSGNLSIRSIKKL